MLILLNRNKRLATPEVKYNTITYYIIILIFIAKLSSVSLFLIQALLAIYKLLFQLTYVNYIIVNSCDSIGAKQLPAPTKL